MSSNNSYTTTQERQNVVIGIDDDPLIVKFCEMQVRGRGYTFRGYTSAEEAWKDIDSGRDNCLFAIIDNNLKSLTIDGQKLTQLLKQKSPETLVIRFSSNVIGDGNPLEQELDGDLFVSKPVELKKFRTALDLADNVVKSRGYATSN